MRKNLIDMTHAVILGLGAAGLTGVVLTLAGIPFMVREEFKKPRYQEDFNGEVYGYKASLQRNKNTILKMEKLDDTNKKQIIYFDTNNDDKLDTFVRISAQYEVETGECTKEDQGRYETVLRRISQIKSQEQK
jgi:hypothetical protein